MSSHPVVAAVSDRRRRSEIDATIYVPPHCFGMPTHGRCPVPISTLPEYLPARTKNLRFFAPYYIESKKPLNLKHLPIFFLHRSGATCLPGSGDTDWDKLLKECGLYCLYQYVGGNIRMWGKVGERWGEVTQFQGFASRSTPIGDRRFSEPLKGPV